MLSPQDIQQIKSLIAQDSAENRFRISPSNRHVHNNVDAPFVFLPYQVFAGFVPYDGNVGGLLEVILPKGWTVTYNGTGDYTITHNLGNATYAFVASATQSTNTVVSTVVETFKNEVDVGWFDTSAARADTSFNFVLVLLSGNDGAFPTYFMRNVQNT